MYMSKEPCPICHEIAGRAPTPGGIIFDDGLWVVTHHRGPYTDPGELIVQTRRHCESMAELTASEAAAVGPVLRSAVGIVERLVAPERVYVASHSERVLHVHFFILPRTAALPKGHVLSDVYRRGRHLLRRFGVAKNPAREARVRMAERMREEWPA
jgi:diadenosine tetraphosphate (Ap4A) HIT family hydrolase